MPRTDGRTNGQLRPTEIVTGFQRHPAGSALVRTGDTWVACAAHIEDRVPFFVAERGPGNGWLTAEYGMLPSATHTRGRRDPGGRGKEIQRLIGRSLRAAVDLSKLGERTVTVDCDVLQADGGTRVASITGAYVAVMLALEKLVAAGALESSASVFPEPLAAVSVGIVDGEPRLDLAYSEDSSAGTDMNIVMTESGGLVEVQGTAEGDPFSRPELDQLLDLAQRGISELCQIQRAALASVDKKA